MKDLKDYQEIISKNNSTLLNQSGSKTKFPALSDLLNVAEPT